MPSTWKQASIEVYGEVREQTPVRERYVAWKKIERWLEEGYTPRDVAAIWNQGHPGKCSSGVNKHGVAYNSCEYINKVLAQI